MSPSPPTVVTGSDMEWFMVANAWLMLPLWIAIRSRAQGCDMAVVGEVLLGSILGDVRELPAGLECIEVDRRWGSTFRVIPLPRALSTSSSSSSLIV